MDNSTKHHISTLRALASEAGTARFAATRDHDGIDQFHIANALYMLTEVVATAVIAAMEEDEHLTDAMLDEEEQG